jgi:hypothetical protein
MTVGKTFDGLGRFLSISSMTSAQSVAKFDYLLNCPKWGWTPRGQAVIMPIMNAGLKQCFFTALRLCHGAGRPWQGL